jgi:hypothetical protein
MLVCDYQESTTITCLELVLIINVADDNDNALYTLESFGVPVSSALGIRIQQLVSTT